MFETLSYQERIRDLLLGDIESAEKMEDLAATANPEQLEAIREFVETARCRRDHAEVEVVRVTEQRDESLLSWRAKVREENNFKKWCEYALPRLLDSVREEAELLAAFLAASQAAQGGVGGKPVYLPPSQTTDDVGFIIDLPPRRLATWGDVQHFVRSPKEFEALEADD